MNQSRKTNTMKACFGVLLISGILLGGCTKYEPAASIPDAAYLRVFNSIATSIEPTSSGGFVPFLTFLLDPSTDDKGAFTGSPVMCDFLTTRQLFSASYPMDAGTDPSAPVVIIDPGNTGTIYNGRQNYEYPGKAHVPAAPAMNGFDMSSWAQVKPGKHRVVFVVRPRNDIPFSAQDTRIRKTVLIDTTIELKAGEVYTLSAVQTDQDSPVKYGAYLREENFHKQSFEENKTYVGFDNISGKYPQAAQHGFKNFFADTVNVFYSYLMRDPVPGGVNRVFALENMNNLFFTTLSKKQSGQISSYLSLPMLSRSYFFYKDNTLKTFPSQLFTNVNGQGEVQKDEDLPFVKFEFFNYNKSNSRVYRLNCSASPVTLPFYNQDNQYVRNYQSNFNLIINKNNKVSIYPTVNILEISYDRVYMMQMQRAFNKVPE